MSIRMRLLEAVGKGLLVQVTPDVLAGEPLRKMYLAKDLHELLASYLETGEDAVTPEQQASISRLAQLRVDLEEFLISDEIGPEYMKQLFPAGKGVYEIKSVYPKPSLRVFGRFIYKDVFLATHVAERKVLSDWNSFAFKQEIAKCRKIWGAIFPNHRAMEGGTLSALVSGGHDERV